jgi:hypothetical protein
MEIIIRGGLKEGKTAMAVFLAHMLYKADFPHIEVIDDNTPESTKKEIVKNIREIMRGRKIVIKTEQMSRTEYYKQQNKKE